MIWLYFRKLKFFGAALASIGAEKPTETALIAGMSATVIDEAIAKKRFIVNEKTGCVLNTHKIASDEVSFAFDLW